MKKLPLFITLAVIVLLNSCTKDSGLNANNTPDTSLKVKTLTEDVVDSFNMANNTHTVFTLSYDGEDRLIKMESENYNIDFEYGNNIIKKNIYEKGQPAQHFYYYFKNDLLLDSSVVITESSPGDTMHATYIYNEQGQLEQEIDIVKDNVSDKDSFVYEYTYDSRGNLTGYLANASWGYYGSGSYTYSDSANFSNSADMIYPDKIYSPNLLEKASSDSWVPGSGSIDSYYKYKFDNNHRIVEIIRSDIFSTGYVFTFTTSYTY